MLAEDQVSEQTLMAIARQMRLALVEHYSHIRMAKRRSVMEGIAKVEQVIFRKANQNVHRRAVTIPEPHVPR
jgi:hypothetical protein